MNKRNKILAGLLVVQLLFIATLYLQRGEAGEESMLLTSDLDVQQIDHLQISDDVGKELSIRKIDNGWQVEIDRDVWYPVVEEKVENLLAKLAGLQSTRLVTRTKASHGRLKVSDKMFARRIKLGSDKKELRTIYLGTAPNYKSIHVRVGGDDNVYLVRDFSAWEVQAEPGAWWRTSYLEIDPGGLLEVGVKNGNGEFLLTRNDVQGKWSVQGRERKPDSGKTANFLEDVSGLSVTDILSPSGRVPQGQPIAVLSLKSAGQQVEVKVWERKDENSDHPVKSSESAFYAMAGRYAVDDLLKISDEDLYGDAASGNSE